MKYRLLKCLLGVAIFALPALPVSATTDAEILNDQSSTENVLSNGLGPRGQRYSPLAKLNKSNVSNLIPAWAFSFGGEKQRGQEAQPLIEDGVMYVTASYSRLYAIDARTGEELWQYEARLPDGIMPCCDVINRGAALHGDKVIFGTLDAKLVALNKKNGKVVWSKKLGDYKAGYSYTAAPLIANGLVLTGVSGGEFGIVGRVDARDVNTGELVWTRPTVEGHMGKIRKNGKLVDNGISGTRNASWPGEMWKWGGAATWLGGTYDPDTGLAFFGTGNPAPWNAYLRKGDNLFSTSTVAIDVTTGKIQWHFQGTPNDHWDYDGVNEFISFDYIDGKTGRTVRAGAKADRNGHFYVLDRTNGKCLRAMRFVEVNWTKGLDKDCRPTETLRPGDPGSGKKGSAIKVKPSFLGGKNWMPMAYSQRTGNFYVPSNEWSMDLWNEPVTYKKGAAYLGAGFTIRTIHDDFLGALKAIDPRTGAIKWERRNKAPLWGGVLTTGGGLVFYGTPEGHLMALDDETGDVLWKFQTGSGIVGSPVTWEMDGEQYVTVVSGWGGAVPLWGGDVAKLVKYLNQGGMVWTFRLPKMMM